MFNAVRMDIYRLIHTKSAYVILRKYVSSSIPVTASCATETPAMTSAVFKAALSFRRS